MWLCDIIDYLESIPDKSKICPVGFRSPHSYRGFYEQLAFEPTENVTVQEMLDAAKEADGTIYAGWKGGEFKMWACTDCWVAFTGHGGDKLSLMVLRYLVEGILPNPMNV